MAVRHSVFDHPFRAIVHHPVISELGIKLRAKARSKETIAKKTARRVQDKNLELRLRNRESMNALRWFRRGLFIITLYSIGLSEAYYLPRYGYGIEWLLGALGATAFLAGFWMRTHQDIY